MTLLLVKAQILAAIVNFCGSTALPQHDKQECIREMYVCAQVDVIKDDAAIPRAFGCMVNFKH